MITKQNIIVIASSVIIAAAIPFIYRSHTSPKEYKIDYKTFYSGPGWGYDIVVNGKLFIHQQYVPVVAAKKEFTTELQARETAELVVNKLKNNKLPTLSKAEVEQICGAN